MERGGSATLMSLLGYPIDGDGKVFSHVFEEAVLLVVHHGIAVPAALLFVFYADVTRINTKVVKTILEVFGKVFSYFTKVVGSVFINIDTHYDFRIRQM